MIGIFQGSMTAKERVLRTFNHEKADRVPVNYLANPAIHKRVAAALGVLADKDSVNDALGVDFKELMPRCTGRTLFSPREGRRVHPLTGAVQRWVPNQDGGYWDHCDSPRAEADDETIANWPVPDPDDFDYDELLDRCKLYRHKAVHFGHPGVSDVMNNTGMIRGMENIYMDLALETESVMTLLDRRMKAELAMFERALDKCRDYVDFIWTGEDLGTQRAPLISLDMFRAQIRPRHQPLIDLASSYGKPVMIHCCSSWAFEDFIENGHPGGRYAAAGSRGHGPRLSCTEIRRQAGVPRVHFYGKAGRDDARSGGTERGGDAGDDDAAPRLLPCAHALSAGQYPGGKRDRHVSDRPQAGPVLSTGG